MPQENKPSTQETKTLIETKKKIRTILLISFVAFLAVAGGILWFLFMKKPQPEQPPVVPLACPQVSPIEFGVLPDKEKATLEASLLDGATREISKKDREYQKTKDSAISKELQDLAKSRKQYLVEAMRRNPDSAMFSFLTESERNNLIAISTNCVETPATMEGNLEVLHADFFDENVSADQYALVTAQGEKIVLHPAQGLKEPLLSGMKVKVKGLRIDNDLLFDGTASIESPNGDFGGFEVIQSTTNPPVFGDQKTLAVMANFQNTTQPSLTRETTQDVVFNQVNSYYKENSFNKTSLSGEVLNGPSGGWYLLPINQTCDYSPVLNEAIKAVDPMVDFRNYSRLIIVAPMGPSSSCIWAGLGTVGKWSISTQDGTVSMSVAWIKPSYVNLNVIGHELGHNFGNHHASFYDCGSVSIADSGCSVGEYGDFFSIMGNSGNGHYNALHKEYSGWFDISNIQTVTTNGRYIIEPIETATSGLKALKIPRKSNDYLFIEYRQPIGKDTGWGAWSDAYEGALLHTRAFGVANKSFLIDMTPLYDNARPALLVGMTFTDPASGTKITTVSKTASSLTIDVTLGKTDFTPPTVAITSPASNTVVSGTVTIIATASDASGIEKVEFYRSGDTNPLVTDTTAPYEAIIDTTKIPNGTNYFLAKAYDLAGVPGNVAGNVKSSAQWPLIIANTDPTPPSVTLTAPKAGSTYQTPVTVSATASDNVGIWKVEFNKDTDASPFFIDYVSPYETSVSLSLGSHSVWVKVYDFVGNGMVAGPVSFTIGDDSTPPVVSITSPTNGSTVTRRTTVAITAMATDNVGVTKVEFYVNGALTCTDTSASYTCAWKVPSQTGRTYQLQAKGYDAKGNVGSSSMVAVTSK